MSFVHLHVHTEYSLLDGFSNIKKLVARAAELKMPALAITDHGSMYGVIEFYRAARAAGVKPIIGMEAYLAPRSLSDRDSQMDKKPYHLVLLAENETGYRNLLRLASIAQLQGFYYVPRIDRETLARHAEGLIATSGCMSAEIPRALLEENPQEAVRRLNWYHDVFGPDRFFIELQHHNIPELLDLNRRLLELGARHAMRYVATNDVHYINPGDARLQDILLAIQTNATLSDPKRMRMTDPTYHLRTPEEMARLFAEVPEALSNTLWIAERASVDLDFKGYHLPPFEVPEGHTPSSYLRALCEQGLQRRYGTRADAPEVRQRLEYELGVIQTMGFASYFLIVWDLCRHARESGIWYNARGSAAGSLVAYALEITLVDPLAHGLLFERFLNPGRISMPDIDLDFRDDRRAEMLEYAARKYGDDRVAQIITFGTLGARAAIRDVGRVMGVPLTEVDRIAKMVPFIGQNKDLTLSKLIAENPELRKARESSEQIARLLETAAEMEGVVRNAGTHAAGVVISDRPLVEYLPLHRPTSGAEETPIKTVTQFEMGILDSLGMLKVDFLGLATLTIMARACEMIERRHGVRFNLGNIPTDDPATFRFLSEGHTAGVFQLEGSGMTRWLVQMKPTTLEHVIAMVALFRPGPMEFIPKYIDAMHGRRKPEYRHPALEPIFASTYGIPVYQEQLMRAAIEIAGYSPSEADELRSAISKKKAHEIEKHRIKFVEGAVARGMDRATATAIYADWEEFARYGFNKSHAADYGVIAVQTAYLKLHYPAEYMTALLSVTKNETEKIAVYVAEARTMGLDVLPPDVRVSEWDFSIEDRPQGPAIRFGLGAVKNVGQGAVELILRARAERSFSSLNDFARRVDLRQVGRRTLECLIKVGALDGFGERAALLATLDQLIGLSSAHFRAAESGQLNLFDALGGTVEEIHLPAVAQVDRRQLLDWERELLGLYVSDHPLTPHQAVLSQVVTHFSGQLGEAAHQERVRLAGLVVARRPHQTKSGNQMGFVTLEDIQGTVELVLFPRVWEQYGALAEPGRIILADGKVDAQSNPPKLLVDSLRTEIELIVPRDLPPSPTPSARRPIPSASLPDRIVEEDDSDVPPPPEDIFPPGWDQWTPAPSVVEGPVPSTGEGLSIAEPVAAYAESGTPSDAPRRTVADQPASAVPAAAAPAPGPVEPPEPPLPPVPPPDLHLPSMYAAVAQREGSDQPPRQITILLRSSGDRARDRRRIKIVHGTLISFPGRDRFSFHIFEDGRGVLIDFPGDTTRICPELLARLRKVLGEECWRIEPITYQ